MFDKLLFAAMQTEWNRLEARDQERHREENSAGECPHKVHRAGCHCGDLVCDCDACIELLH